MRIRLVVAAAALLSQLALGVEQDDSDRPVPSPNGAFRIVNIPVDLDREIPVPGLFQIQLASGKVLLSAAKMENLDGAYSLRAWKVRWSPDSKHVAFTLSRFGVLVFRVTKQGATEVGWPDLPEKKGWEGQPVTEKWLDAQRLRLTIYWKDSPPYQWECRVIVQMPKGQPNMRLVERTKIQRYRLD